MDAGNVNFRLLGFTGFEASERFLRALDDEIWVARGERSGRKLPRLNVHRPTGLGTAEAMKSELTLPCEITVISAHAGEDDHGMFFCGEGGDDQVLHLNSLGKLGATSMVLIDACWAKDLFAELQGCARPGTLPVLAGLDLKGQTQGHQSVSAIGDVVRELCYSADRLDPAAARDAIRRVNAKIDALKTNRPLVMCR